MNRKSIEFRAGESGSKLMPRDLHQGLFFMLGFLLACYVLLPFLGADV